MNKINSFLTAALIASASFGGAALANEGDFYQGTQKSTSSVGSTSVDTFSTGSISNGHSAAVRQDANQADPLNSGKVLNRGDYYEGANRPN